MADTLRFSLEPRPHPHPDDERSRLEAWGHLSINAESGDRCRLLLGWEWDLADLAAWFADNRDALLHEALAIGGVGPGPSESLAEAVRRLQGRDVADDDDAERLWFDALFSYRERHALRSALRGARVPDIFIGCNRGMGEISLSSQDDRWAYRFDIEEVVRDLGASLQAFLATWSAAAQDPAARARATRLLERLQSPDAATVPS